MNRFNKFLTLYSVFLLLSSLLVLTTTPTNVLAVYKPSVPQFSVKLVDYSYEVYPVPTTDPYTGPITIPGYRVENKTIEVTIKNQLFTPYTDEDGHKINLYYIIQFKGHYEEWQSYESYSYSGTRLVQSDSSYTIYSMPTDKYAYGSKLDFRVQAVIGYDEYVEYTSEQQADIWNSNPMSHMILSLLDGYTRFVEITSNWGGVQTITIGDGSIVLNNGPSATFNDERGQPQVLDQMRSQSFMYDTNPFLLLMVCVFLCGIIVVVVMVLRNHLKTSTYTNDSPQNDVHTESSPFT